MMTEAEAADVRRFVLAHCTPRERLVLMLHYLEGLTLADVATVLELPRGAVEELFEQARAKVAAHLNLP